MKPKYKLIREIAEREFGIKLKYRRIPHYLDEVIRFYGGVIELDDTSRDFVYIRIGRRGTFFTPHVNLMRVLVNSGFEYKVLG